MTNFADSLIESINQKKTSIVVGLDPMITEFPDFFIMWGKEKFGRGKKAAVSLIREYMKIVIDCVFDYVVAVKPQTAFFEVYGPEGIAVMLELISYAHMKNCLVIEDCKRGDIGTTATAYAEAHLGETTDLYGNFIPGFGADAITVNPYFGTDGVVPFIQSALRYGRGLFISTKTSNPSACEFQDQILLKGKTLAVTIAEAINCWGAQSIGKYGYSSFLVPGYGAQGASAEELGNYFNKDGYGALISASRSVLYSHKKNSRRITTFKQLRMCIKDTVVAMGEEIEKVRGSL